MWWLMTTPIHIRRAGLSDSSALAEMHEHSFGRGWSETEFEGLLQQDKVRAFIGLERSIFGRLKPVGFVLFRSVEDEAEILSLGVMPDKRRRGLGRQLMDETLRELYRERVSRLHLEVDARNQAALALYRTLDFDIVAERKGYYRQGLKEAGRALVMAREIA